MLKNLRLFLKDNNNLLTANNLKNDTTSLTITSLRFLIVINGRGTCMCPKPWEKVMVSNAVLKRKTQRNMIWCKLYS